MKYFIKVFSVAMLLFLLVAGVKIYGTYKTIEEANSKIPNYDENWLVGFNEEDNLVSLETYAKYVSGSHRINFLIVGLEYVRTDTIIFASFDTITKNIDLISIPRDTYYYKEGFRSGFEDLAEYKINAVYGDEDISGLKTAIEDMMNLPIDYYITVTMSGVEKIIDTLGGIEIEVPFDMYYEDIYDNPPLLIDLKAGNQVLNGKQSVEFLRFRKSSDGKISYGDIQRIQQQQEFMAKVAKKALGFRLPLIVNDIFNCVNTDIGVKEIVGYATDIVGVSTDSINFYTLPGEADYIGKTSFYIYNTSELQKLIYTIYSIPYENTATN